MWLEMGWMLQQSICEHLFEYNHDFVLEQASLEVPQMIFFPPKKLLKWKYSF